MKTIVSVSRSTVLAAVLAIGFLAISAGAHTVYAAAAGGNTTLTTGSIAPSVNDDDNGGDRDLRITNEEAEQESNTRASISWETNISADCDLYYGTDSVNDPDEDDDNYGYDEVASSHTNNDRDHEITVSGLTQGETYHFRPVCEDGNDTEIGDEVDLKILKGEILGSQCQLFVTDYLRADLPNDPSQVMKLQAFLNVFEHETLAVNGVFDQATLAAVNRFQVKYADDILNPWGYPDNHPTGYVYITTQNKINEIFCNRTIELTQQQQEEIEQYRELYQGGLVGVPTRPSQDVTQVPTGTGTTGVSRPSAGVTTTPPSEADEGTTTGTTSATSTATSTDNGEGFSTRIAAALQAHFGTGWNFLLAPCFLLFLLGVLLGLLGVELYKGRSGEEVVEVKEKS